MKRIVVVVMAVLVLGLSMPKPSEASGAWIPAAVVGGIILGAALTQPWHPGPVYAYSTPEPVYVYRPPAPVHVYHAPPAQAHYMSHGYRDRAVAYGHRHDGGRSLPHHQGWDRGHR